MNWREMEEGPLKSGGLKRWQLQVEEEGEGVAAIFLGFNFRGVLCASLLRFNFKIRIHVLGFFLVGLGIFLCFG